jgi:hypothetical protein
MQIRCKPKYIAGKGMYGYKRMHNGNSNKKIKKVGQVVSKHPELPGVRTMVMDARGRTRMVWM